MKFFIGALSLIVILATFGAPALFVFGWGGLTAGNRTAIGKSLKSFGAGSGAPGASMRTGQESAS
ncbi:MAG TPA: hypothetical protein VNJ31_10685 [Methyloceanibacter sp.]|nr:hypothetical protein [Methyloceanibacter sp.]